MAAANTEAPMPATIFETAAANAKANTMRISRMQRVADVVANIPPDNTLDADVWDYSSVVSLIITEVNGSMTLPKQAVVVEYLKDNQKLAIPVALGMDVNNGAWVGMQQTLADRYMRVSQLTYVQLKELTTVHKTRADMTVAIDAIELPQGTNLARKNDWNENSWCTLADGQVDTAYDITLTFATISLGMQANCDVRDFFKLNDADMMVADNAWQNVGTVPFDRLKVKLKPFTLQYVAALNLPRCANDVYAAWVRAYGLAVGVLHTKNSASMREMTWTARLATKDDLTAIQGLEEKEDLNIYPMALNVIAMFGLMHLNKDHTYRTGDNAMGRINTSYMRALRTILPAYAQDWMSGHPETICRTAAHPFGLAQTYWLALVMGKYETLAAPLAIRTGVCPPPVQRALIVEAAHKEWNGIAVGMKMSTLYRKPLKDILTAIAEIRLSPPSYSGLHHLYGIADQKFIGTDAQKAIATMMPCCYGYAKSQHESDGGEQDGIALALSLSNVARDQKGLTNMWKGLWDEYILKTSTEGIEKYIQISLQVYTADELAGEE